MWRLCKRRYLFTKNIYIKTRVIIDEERGNEEKERLWDCFRFSMRQSYLYWLIIFLLSQNRSQTMTSHARWRLGNYTVSSILIWEIEFGSQSHWCIFLHSKSTLLNNLKWQKKREKWGIRSYKALMHLTTAYAEEGAMYRVVAMVENTEV